MSLTAWKTYASGDVMTAADRNTYERDNGRWLSHSSTGGAPMCRVFRNVDQAAMANNASIVWNDDHFDVGNMRNHITNMERIDIPTGGGGKYLVGGSVRLASTASSAGLIGAYAKLTSGTKIAESAFTQEFVGTRTNYFTLSTLYQFADTDNLEIAVDWTNMSNVDAKFVGDYSPEAWAIWIAE